MTNVPRATPNARASKTQDAAAGGTEQNIGSLQRGLAILDAIIQAERPITLGEIAALVRLNPSTTHRLLRSLSDLDYVYRDSARRYYPGARALFPASLFHPLNALRRSITEELLNLRNRFGLAAAFVAFSGNQRWVMEAIHGIDFLSPYSGTVVFDSLHATVSGKILLSNLSADARSALLGADPYEAHTPRTLATRSALDSDLALIARQGYCVAIDEFLLGLSAVGAPIFCEPRCCLGALILSGPTKRFDAAGLAEFAQAAVSTAALYTFASPHARAVCQFLGHQRQ